MKPIVIDPQTTSRAEAYALRMDAPNPMVTFFKTLDVTPLIRLSRKRGLKCNLLLCFCIGRAASMVDEFYMLPVGRELLQYDAIAVNIIIPRWTAHTQDVFCNACRRASIICNPLRIPTKIAKGLGSPLPFAV